MRSRCRASYETTSDRGIYGWIMAEVAAGVYEALDLGLAHFSVLKDTCYPLPVESREVEEEVEIHHAGKDISAE